MENMDEDDGLELADVAVADGEYGADAEFGASELGTEGEDQINQGMFFVSAESVQEFIAEKYADEWEELPNPPELNADRLVNGQWMIGERNLTAEIQKSNDSNRQEKHDRIVSELGSFTMSELVEEKNGKTYATVFFMVEGGSVRHVTLVKQSETPEVPDDLDDGSQSEYVVSIFGNPPEAADPGAEAAAAEQTNQEAVAVAASSQANPESLPVSDIFSPELAARENDGGSFLEDELSDAGEAQAAVEQMKAARSAPLRAASRSGSETLQGRTTSEVETAAGPDSMDTGLESRALPVGAEIPKEEAALSLSDTNAIEQPIVNRQTFAMEANPAPIAAGGEPRPAGREVAAWEDDGGSLVPIEAETAVAEILSVQTDRVRETEKNIELNEQRIVERQTDKVQTFDFNHEIVQQTRSVIETGPLIAENFDDLELKGRELDLSGEPVEGRREVSEKKESQKTLEKKFSTHLDVSFRFFDSSAPEGSGVVVIEEKAKAPMDLEAEKAAKEAEELRLQAARQEAELQNTKITRQREREEEEEQLRQRGAVESRFIWPEEEEESDDSSQKTELKAATAAAAARKPSAENKDGDDELILQDKDEKLAFELKIPVIEPEKILQFQAESREAPIFKTAEPDANFENVIAPVVQREEGQAAGVEKSNVIPFREVVGSNTGIEIVIESDENQVAANAVEQESTLALGRAPVSATQLEETAASPEEIPLDVSVNQIAA